MNMRQIIALLFFLNLASARYEVYNGYSTYQVVVKDNRQLKEVNGIEDQLALDVWSPALPGRPGIVFVPRDKSVTFEDALYNAGVNYKKEVENIQELLDIEENLLRMAGETNIDNASVVDLPFHKIYDYYKIYEYIEDLSKRYPDLVTLETAGKSHEGRPIKYLKISTTKFMDKSKPIIYLQSLLHAREWITSPATLYAIRKLVVDVTEKDIQKSIDWIILPIVNPDGYMVTHTDYRFWRKNKATSYSKKCPGVDLNRNFNVSWGEFSSSHHCDETFHGGSPVSEPETQAVESIIHEHVDRIKLFLDIHSFGSKILYSFGNGTIPANGKDIHNLGVIMANAIDSVKVRGNPYYEVGNGASVLYKTSGSAEDYATSVGVPFTYTLEMPGYRFADLDSEAGFLVDPTFIEHAGNETWSGILAAARQIKDKFGKKFQPKKKPCVKKRPVFWTRFDLIL